MTPRRAATALLLLAAATTTGCAATPDLAGHTYVADDAAGHDLVPGSTITLAFGDGTVSAQPGCNTLTGPATWDDGVLHLDGQLAATRKACTDDLMAQDDWFATLLAAEPTLTTTDESLLLESGDVTVVLSPAP